MPEPISTPPPGSTPTPPAEAMQPAQSTSGQTAFVRKWLGPGATDQQVHQFLNQLFQNIINEVKKDEARAKKASDYMKKVIKGQE